MPGVIDATEDDAVAGARGRRLRGRRRGRDGGDARRGRDRARAGPGARRRSRPNGLEGHDHRRRASSRTPDPERPTPEATPVRVAVLHGGRSSEHDVSLASAESAIAPASPRPGTRCVPVLLERDGRWRGPDGAPLSLAPGGGLLGADVAFPVLHGPFGEDGTVQGLLELLDVPYVGAGVLASSLCMDKVVFKDVLAAAGVPQVDYAGGARGALARRAGRRARGAGAARPAAVRQAGAARLLGRDRQGARRDRARRRARRRVRARRARDRRGVQRRHGGRVRGDRARTRPRPRCPARSSWSSGAEWYDYEAKYSPTAASSCACPPRSRRGRRARCAGWRSRRSCASAAPGLARVDFFVEDGGRVLVNELNTLPGMTPTSAFPKLWEAAGVPWPEACDRLLQLALERHATSAATRSELRGAVRRGRSTALDDRHRSPALDQPPSPWRAQRHLRDRDLVLRPAAAP